MAEKTLVKQNQKGTYNWNMVVVLTLIPLIGVFGTGIYVYNQGVVWQEPLLLFILWFLSGMGITMGYHRLFSHKAYKTNVFVEWLLMIFGSMALENTILKWCSDHRIHHTKAETKEDPYSITEGFWHAHIGWIVKNGSEENNRVRGVKDLKSKSAVVFQNKYYFTIGIIGGFIIPLAIGFIYGRPMGALLWAGFLRLTIVHHATFFINSMCHYFGRQTYDIKSTARDSWFVSWFTFGEGYHNYHHKFQWDYRNGVKWFAYDPSKWIIKGLSFFGITYDLKEVKENVIEENKLNNIKVQLFEMFKISGSKFKKMYYNKVESLNKKSEQLFELWSDMEIKYAEQLSKGKSKNKEVLRALIAERKKYKEQLNRIRIDLQGIMSSIKSQKLKPNLT
ncbi:MAG: acyl-CoA desaturase [Crocinitomicaceae bacterium]|nr:acyl-CoA desaturase [Crocinitomicaceae bacterium]MDG1735791.1 acyl-CoA desaturase [Crocinitomicaceae bacterium]MDG2506106.1 acyl-CoA desaturase [Crocinitomicaceae bacterium]